MTVASDRIFVGIKPLKINSEGDDSFFFCLKVQILFFFFSTTIISLVLGFVVTVAAALMSQSPIFVAACCVTLHQDDCPAQARPDQIRQMDTVSHLFLLGSGLCV